MVQITLYCNSCPQLIATQLNVHNFLLHSYLCLIVCFTKLVHKYKLASICGVK